MSANLSGMCPGFVFGFGHGCRIVDLDPSASLVEAFWMVININKKTQMLS